MNRALSRQGRLEFDSNRFITICNENLVEPILATVPLLTPRGCLQIKALSHGG